MRHATVVLILIGFAACTVRPSTLTDPSTDTLRAAIEQVLAQYPEATVAISVRDPATGRRLDLNGDRSFHAASTMKVPVMIELYRQARLGRFSLDDSLLVENAFRSIVDGSPYRIEDDSDDAIYERLGEQMAIRDLIYQMITVSSNLATNLLIGYVSADSVQATIERMGTREMRVLRGVEDIKAYRQGLSNRATSSDLAVVMQALMENRAVTEEDDAEMIDILLDQRFNEMIPAGLPEGVRAAHKTGSITRINHDAAIVLPGDADPYVLVLLTEGLDDHAVSAALGARVTALVHERLRGGR